MSELAHEPGQTTELNAGIRLDGKIWLGIGSFLMWLLFSLAIYFVANRPVDAGKIEAVAQQYSQTQFVFSANTLWQTMLNIGAAFWILWVVVGIGFWVWDALPIPNRSPLEVLLFGSGAGMWVLGMLTLFMGLVGLFSPKYLVGLLLVLTPFSILKGWLCQAPQPFWRQVRLRRPPTLITIYLAIAIGLAFTLALLPPTSWDSLSYHLKGPQLYLQAGRIYPGVDVFSLSNPFLLEMLFSLGMAVSNDITAQLIHFSFLFYLMAVVWLIAKQSLKLPTGRQAVLLLLAMPMTLLLAPWSYNDLVLTSMTLVALYAIMQWQEDEQTRWLLWSGVFAGLAISLKYTSFLLPVVIGMVVFWRLWRRPKLLWRALLWFGMPAFLVSFAWYLKNWVFMGNPVYPFVFGGRYWDALRSVAHTEPGTGIGWQMPAILRIPITLTQGIQDSSGDGPVGPFYLTFLPLLLWAGYRRLREKIPFGIGVLLLYAAVHFVLWVLGVINSANLWQGRLLMPALVALIPVMAWVWHDLHRFDHPQFSLGRFLNLALGFVLVFGLIGQFVDWAPHRALSVIAGTTSREEYLQQRLGVLSAASFEINEILPADAVVQFLWEPRTYYCQVDCRGDHILDKYAYLEKKYSSSEGIAGRLKKEGVTHIFIFDGGLNFLRDNANSPATLPADFAAFELFLDEQLVLIQQWDEAYSLYELRKHTN